MRTSSVLVSASMAGLAAAGYSVKEDFSSGNFFDHFNFVTDSDPTHGYVNYVDQNTANSNGYINTNNGVYIGVDHNNVASGSGRDSIRLSSKSSFDTMLVVIDLAHMPGGVPGTWPAFWTFGPNWPAHGEIDIIEGVNDQSTNFMTLHSGNSACTLQSKGSSSLDPFSTDCYYQSNGNEGCSYHDNDSSSYGTGFNQAGGGVFAMELTTDSISIWKWGNGAAPSDALGDSPNPSSWGSPRAQWVSPSGCTIGDNFNQQNIIFDTTFCGDWAGQAYPGGLDACNSFVQNNPGSFSEAYWQVRSLKVYSTDGQVNSANSPPPPAVAESSTVTEAAPTTTSDLPPPPAATTTSVANDSASAPTTTSVANDPAPAPTTTSVANDPAPAATTTISTAATTTVASDPAPATTTAAAPTTTQGGRHAHGHGGGSRSGGHHGASTAVAAAAAVATPAPATTTDVAESVVVNPDGTISELQEPPTINSRRNVPHHGHNRHGRRHAMAFQG